MRFRRFALPALALCALALLAFTTSAAPPRKKHACGANAKITPIAGQPGWFLVETPHGPRVMAHPPAPAIDAAPDYVIDALDNTWNADSNLATEIDTLVVPLNSTIRWHLVTGIHTITNGKDDLDPNAGSRFNFLLDETHTDFDLVMASPETLDFFCAFHVPTMVGTVIARDVNTPVLQTSLGALKERYRGR